MRRHHALPLLIVVLLGPAACASAGGPGLSGELWRWQGQSGEGERDSLEVDHPGRYTLEFAEDGRYTIRADCNSGSGGYELKGERLALLPGPMTLVACGPDSMDARFLAALGKVEGFERDDGSLVLRFRDDAGEMRFSAGRPVDLGSATWLVRGYNSGKQAVVSVLPGTSLHAEFHPDGRVTGRAGCNVFFGSYQVEDDSISIGPLGSSRRACQEPEGVMQQESAFLAAFAISAGWRVRGESLELRTGGGAKSVGLVAAVTGTLALPAGWNVPRDAVVRVRIEDLSRADATSVAIGEQTFQVGERATPFGYEVIYDPADVDPRHEYTVSARVEGPAGDLVYVTPEASPVITGEHPSLGVELALESVR